MKHQVTHGQDVDFLDTLTQVQATGLAKAGTSEEAPTPEGANATSWSRTFGNPSPAMA